MPFDSLPELDEVGLVLHRARGLIEQGWVKGAYRAYNAPHNSIDYCAVGALRQASGTDGFVGGYKLFSRAVDRFARTLPANYPKRKHVKDQGDVVIEWNDRKSRTKKQVLAQFDKALKVSVPV